MDASLLYWFVISEFGFNPNSEAEPTRAELLAEKWWVKKRAGGAARRRSRVALPALFFTRHFSAITDRRN
jgi:hypothetical protein